MRRDLLPRTSLLIIALAATTLAGCTIPAPTSTAPVVTGTGAANVGEVRTVLAGLPVADAGKMTGYSRDHFPHWRAAGPGCDTRDKVLQRDGKNVALKGCNVVGGSWYSWYDHQTLTELSKVDIDHLVPLANAWRSGAASWTDDKRSDFANDMTRPQLFAVSASANRSKGDQDPSQWKPPSRDAWCAYAEDWITVKAYWQLTITAPEKAALADMLNTCV